MIRTFSVLNTSVTICMVGLFIRCAILNPPEDVKAQEKFNDLVITEIHYNPLDKDSVLRGSEFEFVEFYNRGNTEISLEGVSISDGVEYTFGTKSAIKPAEFLVVASNSTEFENRYGFKPFGQYTGKLSNSGERIALMDNDAKREFFAVEFSTASPWPSAADGKGYSLVPVCADAKCDLSDPSRWRASFRVHGSPGMADPAPVYINEILAHTDPPQQDAIELFNPNDFSVDISGWYLSDSRDDPAKFRVPQGSVIEAGGFLVFYANDFNNPVIPYPFNLSANGEVVYLFADSIGAAMGGFFHGFPFDASENGVTIGRYLNSVGEERFVTQLKPTLGVANAGPEQSRVVITEIMYNPENGRDEYIEIKNITTQAVSLFNPDFPANCWKIRGFDFEFPAGVTLAAGEIVLIISDTISADEFRSLYDVPGNVRIFGQAKGRLSNGGETISLMAPLEPNTDGVKIEAPYKLVERVTYGDGGLWPKEADGGGLALVRKKPDQFADDPQNWIAAAPSPGRDSR